VASGVWASEPGVNLDGYPITATKGMAGTCL